MGPGHTGTGQRASTPSGVHSDEDVEVVVEGVVVEDDVDVVVEVDVVTSTV